MSSYSIRNLTRKELDTAIGWAAIEGWNPAPNDAGSFYLTDRNGFFGGFLDNEMIASISAVNYEGRFGFVGLYIVKPEYRGKGYGYQLWQHAMQYLEGINTGLDGVVAQQDNYKKSGFKLAYRNVRYEGKANELTNKLTYHSNVRVVEEKDLEKLIDFDSKYFGLKRDNFVESWIRYKTYIAGENDNITGYGTIRKCGNGYKIGPLFAEDSLTAESLLKALTKYAGYDSVYLDVPEPNKIAVQLAEKLGMKAVYETARMYTGNPPDIPLNKIFGITTFELG